MKILLRIVIMIIALVAIVAVTGFIKFNFSDSDVVLPTEEVKNEEADASKMTLTNKTWSWVKTIYEDGNEVLPKNDKFKITFGKDGRVSLATDCNSMGGEYSVTSSSLKFEPMMSTLMYCEGSQEAEFSGTIAAATKYNFTSKGELILSFNSGEVILK